MNKDIRISMIPIYKARGHRDWKVLVAYSGEADAEWMEEDINNVAIEHGFSPSPLKRAGIEDSYCLVQRWIFDESEHEKAKELTTALKYYLTYVDDGTLVSSQYSNA